MTNPIDAIAPRPNPVSDVGGGASVISMAAGTDRQRRGRGGLREP